MSKSNGVKLVMALTVLAALGFLVLEYIDDQNQERRLQAEFRQPVANPPVEPDRPDLLEEPRIDE